MMNISLYSHINGKNQYFNAECCINNNNKIRQTNTLEQFLIAFVGKRI